MSKGLSELNEKMGLSQSDAALGYPAIIKKFVLHDESFLQAVKILDSADSLDAFIRQVPVKWLYCDNVGQLMDDAAKYLEFYSARKKHTA